MASLFLKFKIKFASQDALFAGMVEATVESGAPIPVEH
jgi:hypothetical protein